MPENYALVTGAGSGIGRALALEIAEHGSNVLLVSKPGEDINDLARYIESTCRVKAASLELDFLNGPEKVIEWIHQHRFNVNILMNNAGIGGSGDFAAIPMTYYDQMIRINMTVPVVLTRLMLDELKKNQESYILYTGSISASLPLPYKAVYSSTKIFLKSFSMALRRELRSTNVKVSIALPGPTITNQRIMNEYKKRKKFIQKWGYATPETVAKKMVKEMLDGKYLIIPGKLCKLFYFATKIFPKKVNYLFLRNAFNNIEPVNG